MHATILWYSIAPSIPPSEHFCFGVPNYGCEAHRFICKTYNTYKLMPCALEIVVISFSIIYFLVYLLFETHQCFIACARAGLPNECIGSSNASLIKSMILIDIVFLCLPLNNLGSPSRSFWKAARPGASREPSEAISQCLIHLLTMIRSWSYTF